MSSTSTITDDRRASEPTRTPRTPWIVGIAVVAIAMVGGFWFFASRGGGPEAFPVLDSDAIAEAEALVEFIEGYEATWETGDLDAFADYLADDGFEFIEPASHITSKQGFIDFMGQYVIDPDHGGALNARIHVADGEVVESYLGWGFGPFTEDNPVVEVDLFTVANGAIRSLHSMYDPALSRLVYGVDPAELVHAYASAWSSGDLNQLRSVYTADATRVEGLYRIELEGIDEITRHAAAFLDRHPGATWTIVDPFIFTSGQLSGAVFTLAEPNGCEIEMTVVVEMDDAGLISAERVYHDIAGIRACGWQR
jgi:ketosteroid isomerase-like protein